MCSCCKMDDVEMRRLYARQGAVEIEDFDDEPRYRKVGSGPSWGGTRKKQRSRTKRGCSANEGKSHIWVWTSECEPTDIFYKHFGFHKYERKICCGCGKEAKKRETETYMRRKEKAWRKITGGEFNVSRGEPIGRRRMWRGRSFWSFEWEFENPYYAADYDEWYERARYAWLHHDGPYPRY